MEWKRSVLQQQTIRSWKLIHRNLLSCSRSFGFRALKNRFFIEKDMELLSVQDSSGQLRYSSVLVKAGNPSQFYAENDKNISFL